MITKIKNRIFTRTNKQKVQELIQRIEHIRKDHSTIVLFGSPTEGNWKGIANATLGLYPLNSLEVPQWYSNAVLNKKETKEPKEKQKRNQMIQDKGRGEEDTITPPPRHLINDRTMHYHHQSRDVTVLYRVSPPPFPSHVGSPDSAQRVWLVLLHSGLLIRWCVVKLTEPKLKQKN